MSTLTAAPQLKGQRTRLWVAPRIGSFRGFSFWLRIPHTLALEDAIAPDCDLRARFVFGSVIHRWAQLGDSGGLLLEANTAGTSSFWNTKSLRSLAHVMGGKQTLDVLTTDCGTTCEPLLCFQAGVEPAILTERLHMNELLVVVLIASCSHSSIKG